MLLPHVCLERLEVERFGRAALHALVYRVLHSLNRLRSLLVALDKVAHIVAGVAEAAILQARLNPSLHLIGKRNVHGCHRGSSVT